MQEENKEQMALYKMNILTKEDWVNFKELFEKVHTGFFTRLERKVPSLTPAETRLICLIKMGQQTEQMAAKLGVSVGTINKTRYRLRKKVKMPRKNSIVKLTESI